MAAGDADVTKLCAAHLDALVSEPRPKLVEQGRGALRSLIEQLLEGLLADQLAQRELRVGVEDRRNVLVLRVGDGAVRHAVAHDERELQGHLVLAHRFLLGDEQLLLALAVGVYSGVSSANTQVMRARAEAIDQRFIDVEQTLALRRDHDGLHCVRRQLVAKLVRHLNSCATGREHLEGDGLAGVPQGPAAGAEDGAGAAVDAQQAELVVGDRAQLGLAAARDGGELGRRSGESRGDIQSNRGHEPRDQRVPPWPEQPRRSAVDHEHGALVRGDEEGREHVFAEERSDHQLVGRCSRIDEIGRRRDERAVTARGRTSGSRPQPRAQRRSSRVPEALCFATRRARSGGKERWC
jgi:hypothetical protein